MTTRAATPARRGQLFIAAAAVAWGTGGAVAAVLNHDTGLGPVTVSFWRFVVAVAILAAGRALPWCTRRGRSSAGGPVSWRAAALTGAGLAIYQTAYFGAVDAAGVALGTLITLGAGPVLIAIGARCVLGERLTRWQGAGIAAAVGGLVLLTAGAGPLRASAAGIGLALLSAAGYSAVTLHARAGRGAGAGLPAFGAGLLGLAPLALAHLQLPHGRDLPAAAGGLLFLGLVPTVLAYRWYFAGLADVPAATASVIALLEPVAATAIGVGLLGEHLTVAAIAGAALLLAAVIALARAA